MAAYSLDITVDHCAECAGYGYYKTPESSDHGYFQCTICRGAPATRLNQHDWEPGLRKFITACWRGYKKMGYLWHYACALCGAQFPDCLTFKENKEAGRFPCCKHPQLVVHNEFVTKCDCDKKEWGRAA